MLDDVMLLTEGRCVYFGERISCLPTLRAAGYTCPPETNPAEFAIDVISVDASSQEKEIESCRRVRALVSAWSRCSAAASPAASALPAAACCGLGGAVVGKGGADKGEDGIADAGLKGRSGPGRPPGGKGLVGRLGRAMRRFRFGGERDMVGGGFSHRRIGPLRAFRCCWRAPEGNRAKPLCQHCPRRRDGRACGAVWRGVGARVLGGGPHR